MTPTATNSNRIRDAFDVALPSNVDAEAGVIGAMLIDPSQVDAVFSILSVGAFTLPEHRHAASVIRALHDDGKPVDDLFLIEAKAKSLGLWGDDEGQLNLYLVNRLFEREPHGLNAKHYAELVNEAAQKRRQVLVCQQGIHAALNGKSAGEAIAQLREGLEYIDELAPADDLFPRYTAAELDSATFDQRYAIKSVLVEGEPCQMGGPMKAMKTSIAMDASISLATGTPFLGKYDVPAPRRVLFASAESGLASLQDLARRVARQKEMALAEVENLIVTSRVPKVDDLKSLDGFRRRLRADAIEFAFVDPVYMALGGAAKDAHNLFAMGQAYGTLSEICLECGATPIMLHHFKRNGPEAGQPAQLADLSWSGGAEHARQWMLISRRTPYDGRRGGYHELWLVVGGSAGHSLLAAVNVSEGVKTEYTSRYWEVDVLTPDEVKSADERRKEDSKERNDRNREAADRKQVVDVLKEHTEGLTKNRLRDLTKLNWPRLGAALDTLTEAGSVCEIEIKSPHRRKPFEGFQLTGQERERQDKLDALSRWNEGGD